MQLVAPTNVQIKNVVLPPPPRNPFEDRFDRIARREFSLAVKDVVKAVNAVGGFRKGRRIQ